MSKHRTVDILIVTALNEELETLRSHFPDTTKLHSQKCELIYDIGHLPNGDGKLLAFGLTCLYQMGNTDAGVAAANAIRDLSPSFVIMFGLAAGIEGRASRGDVLVSSRVFYYEQAKLYPKKVEIRPQSYQTDALLGSRMRDFASGFAGGFKVKFGPFAVGEKVVAASQTVEDLKESEPKLIGIEMESYGVAKAAASSQHRPRFIAVRGVSDYADENKNDEFRAQALNNAAGFLVAFLRAGTLPRQQPSSVSSELTDTLIAIHHLSLDQRSSLDRSVQRHIPKYQGFEVKELLVNQTDLYHGGCLVEPQEALKRQSDLIDRLNDFVNIFPRAQIGYFGLAHIPLVFLAGYETNRRVVSVFPTNRSSGRWEMLSDTGAGPELYLREQPARSPGKKGDVVVKVSISYQVRPEQVHEIILQPVATYHLSLDEPKPDIVTSTEQLDRYTRVFHGLLAQINAQFPHTQKIHLFLAAPPTVAFRFGQQVSRTVDPDILVYNFSKKDSPCFGWAVNVATGEVIDRRNREHYDD